MNTSFAQLEQTIFRNLNAVVEPAVRRGFGSPRFAPASLIILETLGFRSGQKRRTPLWSFRIGCYRIVSTARGERSFWVKNLMQQPQVIYHLAGRPRQAEAIVITDSAPVQQSQTMTATTRKLAEVLSTCAPRGWVFAILVPIKN